MKPLALMLALGMLAAASCGPPAGTPAASSDAPAVAATPLDAPAELSLGRAVAGTRVKGELLVRATRAVRVLSVESSCECTTASAMELPRDLREGEVMKVEVEMDLSKVGRGGLPKEGEPGPGRVEREIIVKSSGGDIRSRAVVEVSDSVAIEPPTLALGTIALGRTARGSIRVRPLGARARVAVRSVETDEAGLVITNVAEESGARLDVAWTPVANGTREADVRLVLDGEDDPRPNLRVVATAAPAVSVYPDRIEALSAPLTRPVVASLTLRRLDEEPLDLKSVSVDNHRVVVRIEPGQGATRNIHVRIPVLAAPAEMSGTVTIVTGVPGAERLSVPFRVRAAPPG